MQPSLGIDNAANASVIAFLKNVRGYIPPRLQDPDIVQPQAHPDIVERIWQLAAAIAPDCRAIVYGAPALVHPETGVIFVFGTGTVYFLRLPAALAAEAIKAGAFTNHKWSFGGGMDIRQELGEEWIGGRWLQNEPAWCAGAYQQAGEKPSL